SLFDEITIDFSNNAKNEITYQDFENNKRFFLGDCIFTKAIKLLKENKIIENDVFFKITVIKKLPLFSGLGSGSSNVACLFLFLLKNKKIKLNNKVKKTILKISSDLMFFIKQYDCAKVFGYGEKVKKIKLKKEIKVKLFFNNIRCSSKDVFNYFDTNTFNKKNYYLNQFLYFKIIRNKRYKNDLQISAFNLYKDLLVEFEKLKKENNKEIFLSGSGGTFFSILSD
ncbi:MAG: hypothetical protein K2H51_01590, partial [Malacoplasma sp.]|nr:hypothetical protein [Malacoplasma sp.]